MRTYVVMFTWDTFECMSYTIILAKNLEHAEHIARKYFLNCVAKVLTVCRFRNSYSQYHKYKSDNEEIVKKFGKEVRSYLV